MTKEMWLIVLGILAVVVPYTGFPGVWKTVFFVVAGITIAAIGFLLRGEALSRGDSRLDEHFVESVPSSEPHEAPTINSLN